MKRQFLALLVILSVLSASFGPHLTPAQAQGDNLLQNPGMEKPFVGMGSPTQTAPDGWRLWFSGAEVVAFPHVDPNQIHGGETAWNFNKGFQVFTAGGYQTVGGISPGSVIRASVYGLTYTCNNQATSCINGSGQRISDQVSGAGIKVGIDPSGGTDPNSALIVWSGLAGAYDNWTPVSIDATACNTSATLFFYTTQALPMAINNAYFDDASLRVVQAAAPGATVTCSNAAPAGTPGAPVIPTDPPQVFAPFVQKQGGALQPDGSIIHTMVAGDTLAAIALAYGITLDEIRTLNGYKPGEGGFLQIGTKIIVRGPTPGAAPGGPPTSQPGAVSPTPVAVAVLPTVTPATPVQFTEVVITGTPRAIAQLPPAAVSSTPSLVMQGLIVLMTNVLRIWLTRAAAG